MSSELRLRELRTEQRRQVNKSDHLARPKPVSNLTGKVDPSSRILI